MVNNFRDEIRVKCTLYFHFYCKSCCFWRNLHCWQKFYTALTNFTSGWGMQIFIDLQDKKTKIQHGIQNLRFSKSARERESSRGHKTKKLFLLWPFKTLEPSLSAGIKHLFELIVFVSFQSCFGKVCRVPPYPQCWHCQNSETNSFFKEKLCKQITQP